MVLCGSIDVVWTRNESKTMLGAPELIGSRSFACVCVCLSRITDNDTSTN